MRGAYAGSNVKPRLTHQKNAVFEANIFKEKR